MIEGSGDMKWTNNTVIVVKGTGGLKAKNRGKAVYDFDTLGHDK